MDCLTQHYDNARTGWNNNEPTLTPATVGSGKFSRAFQQPVDGQVYAQPLYVSGLDLPSFGPRNVVFAATEAGSIYAFDAGVRDPVTAGKAGPYWKKSLVPPGERPFNPLTDMPKKCTDITPIVCITSTPVIDRAAGILYATAKTITTSGGVTHFRLHAINLADGTPRQQPVEITGSVAGNGAGSTGGRITFDAKFQNNRPGLLLSGGRLYLAFASHCDHPNYFGWIFGYEAATLNRVAVFNAAPDQSRRPLTRGFSNQAAGIWQGGIGIAADAQGFLYCQSGNGPFDLDLGGKDCGDTVLRLTADLANAGYFTPHDQDYLNQKDLDLGSGGVMLLPDQPAPHPYQMVSCGKEGTVYLMDRENPGGFHANSDGVLRSLPQAILSGVWGGPAYYNGAQGQRIFYSGKNGPLRSISLNNTQLQVVQQSTDIFPTQPNTSDYPPATPVVTSNGSAAGTGVVWATQVVSGRGINLLAFDADNLATRVLDARAGPFRGGPKFTVPTVADGRAFVGTAGQLAVFALHP
jgi:hypothetical protein